MGQVNGAKGVRYHLMQGSDMRILPFQNVYLLRIVKLIVMALVDAFPGLIAHMEPLCRPIPPDILVSGSLVVKLSPCLFVFSPLIVEQLFRFWLSYLSGSYRPQLVRGVDFLSKQASLLTALRSVPEDQSSALRAQMASLTQEACEAHSMD